MLLKCFLSEYVQFNGLTLSGALEEFPITKYNFWVQKYKNKILKKIRVLSAVVFTN